MVDIKKRPNSKKLNSTNIEVETSISNGELITLNFKVPAEWKKQYKQYALDLDMKMIELLKKSFEFYKQHH